MEFKQYIKILKENLTYIVALGVLGFIFATFFIISAKGNYSISQTFYLQSTTPQQDAQDSYYSQEKARNFTDTAIAIINDMQDGSSSISAKKLAPQLIRISAVSKEKPASGSIQKSADNFNQKKEVFGNSVELKALSNQSDATSTLPKKSAIILFGAVVGLLFGITSVAIKKYLNI